MMNKSMVVGFAGKDPEVRYTKSGTAVTNFSVATTDGWGDNKKTNWHNVTCFGKTAEFAGEYISKGSLVAVDGHIDYSTYENKEGVTIYKTQLIANNIQVKNEKKAVDEKDSKEQPPLADDMEEQNISF